MLINAGCPNCKGQLSFKKAFVENKAVGEFKCKMCNLIKFVEPQLEERRNENND